MDLAFNFSKGITTPVSGFKDIRSVIYIALFNLYYNYFHCLQQSAHCDTNYQQLFNTQQRNELVRPENGTPTHRSLYFNVNMRREKSVNND